MSYNQEQRERVEAWPRKGTKEKLRKKALRCDPPKTMSSYIIDVLEKAAKE